jgi:hypothetical protein
MIHRNDNDFVLELMNWQPGESKRQSCTQRNEERDRGQLQFSGFTASAPAQVFRRPVCRNVQR